MPDHNRSEFAAEVRALGGRLTTVVSDLHGLVINECLTTETLILDASGIASRDWSVPYGSVAVHNAGVDPLTIVNGPPAGAAPVAGVGVVVVPSGAGVTANMSGRMLTLYGTAGAGVILSVFTRPQPPAFALLGTLVFLP